MGGTRLLAAIGVLASVGLLAGCCLFSGAPAVTLTASTLSANVGQTVVFTARASGGKAPYQYEWSGIVASGRTASASFAAPGSYVVGVEVIDSCGKRAEDEVMIVVTGDSPGSNLTGTWQGEIVEFTGRVFEIRLSLVQAGNTIQGTAYQAGRASSGSGSIIGNPFMFTFKFWYDTTRDATLTGTVMGNEIRGTWRVGNTVQQSWWVRKI